MSAEAMANLPEDYSNRFSAYNTAAVVIVSVSTQTLEFYQDGELQLSFPISTALAGIGSKVSSFKTPLGWHYVRSRFGDDAPSGTIFIARGNTGKIADIETRPQPTDKDYVTTRILWLNGLEEGLNLGEGIDSYARYIYIHGTHEEGLIGQPASRGCIRMKNTDVIQLYELMPERALVLIQE